MRTLANGRSLTSVIKQLVTLRFCQNFNSVLCTLSEIQMWTGGCCNIDRVSHMLKVDVKRVKMPKRYRVRHKNSAFDSLDREIAHLCLRAGEIYDQIGYLETKSSQKVRTETVEIEQTSTQLTDPIQTLLFEIRKLSRDVQEVKDNQRKLSERLDKAQTQETS